MNKAVSIVNGYEAQLITGAELVGVMVMVGKYGSSQELMGRGYS